MNLKHDELDALRRQLEAVSKQWGIEKTDADRHRARVAWLEECLWRVMKESRPSSPVWAAAKAALLGVVKDKQEEFTRSFKFYYDPEDSRMKCKRCGKVYKFMQSFAFPQTADGKPKMHQLEFEVCHDCIAQIVDLYLLAHFDPSTNSLRETAAVTDKRSGSDNVSRQTKKNPER